MYEKTKWKIGWLRNKELYNEMIHSHIELGTYDFNYEKNNRKEKIEMTDNYIATPVFPICSFRYPRYIIRK